MERIPRKISLTRIFGIWCFACFVVVPSLLAQELESEKSPWQYKSLGEQGHARLSRINAIEKHLEKLGTAGENLDTRLDDINEKKLKEINDKLKVYQKLKLDEVKKDMDKLRKLKFEEKLKASSVGDSKALKELKEKIDLIEKTSTENMESMKKEISNLQFVVTQLQKMVSDMGRKQGGATAGKGVTLPGVSKTPGSTPTPPKKRTPAPAPTPPKKRTPAPTPPKRP